MKASTILLFKIKSSLPFVVLFPFVLFFISVILPLLMRAGTRTINHSMIAIAMGSMISTFEQRNQKLLFQFNVSRKLNFLTSCLQLFITAFFTLVVITLINEFLISVFGASTSGIGPQFTYLPHFFESSIFNTLVYQIKSFVIIALGGSFGLLWIQIAMRYSWKVAFFSIVGGLILFIVPLLLSFVFFDGEFLENYTQWLANPLTSTGVIIFITLIILGIAKLINRNININRDDILKKSFWSI